MLKIAHRGYSEIFKDNSIDAVQGALDNGFDMIELDIQLCKSDHIVIYHDEYINDKMINEYTLDELMTMDIINIEQVMNIIDLKTHKIYFDLKGPENIVTYFMEYIISKQLSTIELKNIYVGCFNRKCIPLLQNFNLPINIGFLTDNNFNIHELIQLTKDLQFISMNWTSLNEQDINILHAYGILVFSYTCSSRFIELQMKKYNLDGIISNIIIT